MTHCRALFGNLHRRGANIDIHDLGIGIAQLLAKEYSRIARSAAGTQRPEILCKVPFPGEAIVVYAIEALNRGGVKTLFLIIWIAQRIRKILILLPYLRKIRRMLHNIHLRVSIVIDRKSTRLNSSHS